MAARIFLPTTAKPNNPTLKTTALLPTINAAKAFVSARIPLLLDGLSE